MNKGERIVAHFAGQDRISIPVFKQALWKTMHEDPTKLSVLISGQVTGTAEDSQEKAQQTLRNEARLRRKAIARRILYHDQNPIVSADIMPALREKIVADTHEARVTMWQEIVQDGTFHIVVMAPGWQRSKGAVAEFFAARERGDVLLIDSAYRRRHRNHHVGKTRIRQQNQ